MRPRILTTTCEQRDIGAAVVLAREFLAAHDGAEALVVVADLAGDAPVVEGMRIVTGADIAGVDFAPLAAAHDAASLTRVLVPYVLADVELPALWLDARTALRGPVELPDGASIVAVADGDGSAGVCDEHVLAVAGPGGSDALAWWRGRLFEDDAGRPLDRIAARFSGVTLVHDTSWRVAGDEERAARVVAEAARLGLNDAAPGWTRMADGTPLDARLRRLYARGHAAGDLPLAPFDPDGAEVFARWLNDPEPDPVAGGLSRYLFAIWQDRPDLHTAYGNLRDAEQRGGFVGWAVMHGASELAMPAWLLPAERSPAADTHAAPLLGVNVAGYFESELGVGEAARRVVAALDAAHVPLLPVQASSTPPSRRRAEHGSTDTSLAPFPINIVCVNADGLPQFAAEAGSEFFRGRRTIGMWWWELPNFPARYHAAFEYVNEIWVGSRYVQAALAPVAPVPVIRVGLPVEAPRVTRLSRERLGLPAGFLVLFVFDFNSVLERKNPLGLIEAFSRAFPPGSGASLVIKTINGDRWPRERQRLRLAAERHPDVHLVDRYLLAAERDAMLASCDVYASLHRSEGFGLTLAEAIALERPALATAYSGNLDFMDAETSWLVPYELVEVGPGNAPYDAASRWAEPDLDAAAAALREIREHPEEAARRARLAAVQIRDEHAPAVIGEAMRQRLCALLPWLSDNAMLEPAPDPLVATRALLDIARARNDRGPEAYPPTGGNPVIRRLRRLLFKGLRPATQNQHDVDGLIMDALGAAADEITRVHQQTRAAQVGHASLSAAVLAGQRRIEVRLHSTYPDQGDLSA